MMNINQINAQAAQQQQVDNEQQVADQEVQAYLQHKCTPAGAFSDELQAALSKQFGKNPFFEALCFWLKCPSGGSVLAKRVFSLNWASRDDIVVSLEEGKDVGIFPPEFETNDRSVITGIWSLLDEFKGSNDIAKIVNAEREKARIKQDEDRTEDEKSFLPPDQLTTMLGVRLFILNSNLIISYFQNH